jgi:hypothetical protein
MDDADRLQALQRFLSALRINEPETMRFRMEPRVFAGLVSDFVKANNTFAARFPMFNTVSGLDCPDFRHGLSIAHAAGMVRHITGWPASYMISVSPRMAWDILEGMSREKRVDTCDFARSYADECRMSVYV